MSIRDHESREALVGMSNALPKAPELIDSAFKPRLNTRASRQRDLMFQRFSRDSGVAGEQPTDQPFPRNVHRDKVRANWRGHANHDLHI